jgi:hypothetical protein
MLAVATASHDWVAISEEMRLRCLRRYSTPPLLATHRLIEYCWQNSRLCAEYNLPQQQLMRLRVAPHEHGRWIAEVRQCHIHIACRDSKR